jgi:hypothetical protein
MPSGDDRRAGPPDFVGAGFEGAGAQWWFDRMLAHPDVEAPHDGMRALHFFDAFGRREMTGDDVADYHRAFRRAPGAITGEWTPRYLADPWTPRLLARAAPGAKVLVMVADPIERYRQVLRARRATIDHPQRRVMTDVAERARHATHLRRLYGHVPAEQVLVLQYERCVADPDGELERTFAFLGVRSDGVTGGHGAPPPPLPRRPQLWPEIRAALHRMLDPEVEALEAMLERFDLTRWPNFAHLAAGRSPAVA